MILIRTNNLESIRPPTPTERLAAWAAKYPAARQAEETVIDMARTRRLKLAISRGQTPVTTLCMIDYVPDRREATPPHPVAAPDAPSGESSVAPHPLAQSNPLLAGTGEPATILTDGRGM